MTLASPLSQTARLRRLLYRGHRQLDAGNLAACEEAGWRLLRQLPPEAHTGSASNRELSVGGLELLALVRRELADFTEAVRLHQRALAVLDASAVSQPALGIPHGRACGDEQRLRCIIHLRLGENLRLLAHYADAEHHHRVALALARSLRPEEPAMIAWSLNGLGIVFKDTRRYPEAMDAYQAALKIATASLEPLCPDLATIDHNLAGLHHAQAKYSEAEPHIRQALRLRRQRADDTSALAADLAVLGAILLGQERLEEAEAALDQALDMWSLRFGPDHYEIGVIAHNLAAVYEARGETTRARKAYVRALTIKLPILGSHHPETTALQHHLDMSTGTVPETSMPG